MTNFREYKAQVGKALDEIADFVPNEQVKKDLEKHKMVDQHQRTRKAQMNAQTANMKANMERMKQQSLHLKTSIDRQDQITQQQSAPVVGVGGMGESYYRNEETDLDEMAIKSEDHYDMFIYKGPKVLLPYSRSKTSHTLEPGDKFGLRAAGTSEKLRLIVLNKTGYGITKVFSVSKGQAVNFFNKSTCWSKEENLDELSIKKLDAYADKSGDNRRDHEDEASAHKAGGDSKGYYYHSDQASKRNRGLGLYHKRMKAKREKERARVDETEDNKLLSVLARNRTRKSMGEASSAQLKFKLNKQKSEVVHDKTLTKRAKKKKLRHLNKRYEKVVDLSKSASLMTALFGESHGDVEDRLQRKHAFKQAGTRLRKKKMYDETPNDYVKRTERTTDVLNTRIKDLLNKAKTKRE